MSEPIRALFDKTLREQGFKKAAGSWYSDRPETVLVVNLQKSQYGYSFYINLGIWLKAVGESVAPKEHHCHVRKMIIVTGIVEVAIPWLEACNSLDGIRKMLHEGRLTRAMVHKEIRQRVGDQP